MNSATAIEAESTRRHCQASEFTPKLADDGQKATNLSLEEQVSQSAFEIAVTNLSPEALPGYVQEHSKYLSFPEKVWAHPLLPDRLTMTI